MAKLASKRYASISGVRVHYCNEVDAFAERVRGRYITKGDGQSISYEAKYQDALIYQGGNPDDRPLKWLEKEAEGTDIAIDELAAQILRQRAQWEEVGSEIEKERLRAKKTINAAANAHEAYEALKRFRSIFPE